MQVENLHISELLHQPLVEVVEVVYLEHLLQQVTEQVIPEDQGVVYPIKEQILDTEV